MIDFEPTDEQQLVIETVRQFARNEMRPAARDCDETGELSGKLLDHAHELGLVANGIDADYGGGGERSAVTGALIAEELAFGDLALALAILSPSLLALPVADHGTDAQRGEILPRFTGERFVPGALAVNEPGLDADPFRPGTRVRAEADGFTIDGVKCQVPWIEGVDQVLVIASDADGPRALLVPRDAPGLTATPERNMGIQALPTVTLRLDGVRVPRSASLESDGGRSVQRILYRGRVALAAAAVGVARAAFEVARDYAKERHAFGGPIATKQAIAFKLADMAIEIDGCRLLTWEAAWNLDQGRDAGRESTLALQQARRVVLDVTDGAVQVLGGHGYIRDYLPEMHLRNARGFASFESLSLV